MNIRDYQIFLEVCRTNNFSKAGRNLFITKSAVLQHISKLESSLEVKLFNRSTRGVSLTTIGEQIKPLAQNIIDDNNAIIQIAHNFTNKIIIGTVLLENPTLINRVLMLNNRLLDHDQIEFKEIKNIKNIEPAIDIIEYYEINKFLDPSFTFLSLKKDPIYIAMPPQHPLAQKSKIKLSDLNNYTLAIEKNGISVIGDQILNILKDNSKINLKIYGIYDSSFFATAFYKKYLICVPKGITKFTQPYVARPLDIPTKASYGIYYRKNCNPIIKHFISLIKKANE